MLRRLGLLLVLVVVTSTATYFLTKSSHTTEQQPSLNSSLQLPKLKESFTVLPCSQDTTLGIEGCQEQAIVGLDTQIDVIRQSILGSIQTTSAKKNFVAAENTWYGYRQANCLAKSDVYAGGSLAQVTMGACVVSLNKAHLADLTTLRESYSPK